MLDEQTNLFTFLDACPRCGLVAHWAGDARADASWRDVQCLSCGHKFRLKYPVVRTGKDNVKD